MQQKVLIADDDAGMCLMLSKIVEQAEGFDVVCQCGDGAQAVEQMRRCRADVVFLDVEMPGMSGVEAAKAIMKENPEAAIIFATAHLEYMPEAFELYAFDYLTKPFRVERVWQTLSRIQSMREQSRQYGPQGNQTPSRLLIKNRESISLVDPSEIILIQREARNTAIYTKDEQLCTSESLGKLWEKLDQRKFLRSHRSYIINTTRISKIYPYGRWTYVVKFKDCTADALITHEKFEELQAVLGENI